MNQLRRAVVWAALGCASAGTSTGASAAGVTTAQALARIDAGDALQVASLVGATNGFGVINSRLEAEGKPLLYCPPRTLSLMPQQIVQILRDYLVVLPVGADITVEHVLLASYQHTFPCPTQAHKGVGMATVGECRLVSALDEPR